MTLDVRVKPRSSRKSVEASEGAAAGCFLTVYLTAPPADNAANEQLIEVLSEHLGVRKSSIKIIKGQTSRNKVVEISDRCR